MISMIDIYQYDLTVSAESIDVLGHVNNREYLRWMEKAAIEHAAALGWDARAYLTRGETWVAREHWIEYLRLTYEGEKLTVLTWVANIQGSHSLRRYAIKRDKRLVCVGATEWVYIDYATGRPKPVPAEVAAAFTVIADDDPRLLADGLIRLVRFIPHHLG